MEFLTFNNSWKSHCVEPQLVAPVLNDLIGRSASNTTLQARKTIDSWHWDSGGAAFQNWPLMSFTLNNFTFTAYAEHVDLFVEALATAKTRTIGGKQLIKAHGAWQILACTPSYRDALLAVVRPQLQEAERLANEFVANLPKPQYQPHIPSLGAKLT